MAVAFDHTALDLRGRAGCRYLAGVAGGAPELSGKSPERMNLVGFFFAAMFATSAVGADWQTAEPGWQYEFPRDHHAHDDFKTEWWYFTGNVFSTEGDRFGYELSFFREGIRPPPARDPCGSRFIVDDLKFAHFALSDISG